MLLGCSSTDLPPGSVASSHPIPRQYAAPLFCPSSQPARLFGIVTAEIATH
jgi:hypothetical protein